MTISVQYFSNPMNLQEILHCNVWTIETILNKFIYGCVLNDVLCANFKSTNHVIKIIFTIFNKHYLEQTFIFRWWRLSIEIHFQICQSFKVFQYTMNHFSMYVSVCIISMKSLTLMSSNVYRNKTIVIHSYSFIRSLFG